MIRTVVLLLIAYLCANISSYDDYTLKILQSIREKNNNVNAEESTTTQMISTVVNGNGSTQTAINDVEPLQCGRNSNYGAVEEHSTTRKADSSTTNVTIINFEQLYSDLKLIYEEKFNKLQIEYDLLKKEHSTTSNANAIHTLQTFCTCNVTERPVPMIDCSNSQTNILLEKVQEIREHLLNITEKIKVPEVDVGCHQGQSDTELQFGERPIDWKQIPGAAVEISAKGKELWAINSAQKIFRWDGSNWEQKPGSAVRVGSSPDGWTWVVNSNDNIYRWNVDKKNWDQMPGALVQISAISKDRALGVNRGHGIFLWSNNAWKKLPGAATWAGIGDGDERWVVNSAQNIYRWNHQINNWQHMPGKAINIDVQSPCRVIVTDASHQMFIWRNNNWQMLNGAGTRSSLNNSHFYTVNSAQQIFMGN